MKIAHIAPLPPARSGIADYAARIAEALAARHELVTVTDPATQPIPADATALYQIGNNRMHASAYHAAHERPGVVVLHDASLHHLLLGEFDEERYITAFTRQYGHEQRDLARQLWRERSQAMHDERYFRYGLTGSLVRAASAVIVHNAEAAKRAAKAGASVVHEAPHFVDRPPIALTAPERAAVRSRLGVGPDEVLFAVFGFLRPAKRLPAIVQALQRVRAPWRLLVCGESAGPHAEQALEAVAGERIIRRPFLPDVDWWPVAASVDVCLNLRYPSAGETSGIALRLMSMAIPVVVTRGLEWSRFPEGSVIQVDAGETEQPMLSEVLDLLARNGDLRHSVGEIAQAYVLREHAMAKVISGYENALGTP